MVGLGIFCHIMTGLECFGETITNIKDNNTVQTLAEITTREQPTLKKSQAQIVGEGGGGG